MGLWKDGGSEGRSRALQGGREYPLGWDEEENFGEKDGKGQLQLVLLNREGTLYK